MNNNIIESARTDLAAYAALLYPKFALPHHIQRIIEELEAVERGEVDRLIIALPPRHGKSLVTSQLFPSWYLGRHPDRSVILTSYGAELAVDFGRKVRAFVADQYHRTVFPQSTIADDNSAAHRFGLDAGGAFYAVGAGGPITGRGADLLLVDDPIKSREVAYSATERKSLQEWYESVAYTRLEPGGAVVIIQTRWHQDDLVGWLLREHPEENWRVVSLPALAEPGDLLSRQEGEALWPERYPVETLERIREAVGTASWAALYQQRPVAEEGGLFKLGWWKRYGEKPPELARRIFAIDTAYGKSQSGDYSAVVVLGKNDSDYFVLHISRGRWDFPTLQAQVTELAKIWRPSAVLVEDAASGQSLIQALKVDTPCRCCR